MKPKPTIGLFFLLILSSCFSSSNADNNTSSLHFPYTIEFGAVGKGADIPPTVFIINQDSIKITTRDRRAISETREIHLKTSKTKFVRLLKLLNEENLQGDRHYYQPSVKDGEYMKIATKLGTRKFTNTFSKYSDKSKIKPDTIGLNKFEKISVYAKSVMLEQNK